MIEHVETGFEICHEGFHDARLLVALLGRSLNGVEAVP